MIYSMTGYGKCIAIRPNKKITIEIKSLNSKNLDLNIKIPSTYKEKELKIRRLIATQLERGKIDVSVYIETTGEMSSSKLNSPLIRDYINQLNTIVKGDEMEHLKIAVRLPDAISTENKDIDEEEWQAIEVELHNAIQELKKYRMDEGDLLKKDFIARIHSISHLLEQVKHIDPERILGVRKRLKKAIADFKDTVDENRFEQELIYYIEKYDITEEKVRLTNHLEYFLSAINSNISNGKKLAFISQEIGREINTIGSKSNYAPMQKLVIQMKDELEKIKEQLLNVV